MVRIHVAQQQFLDHLRPVALRRQDQWGGTELVQVVHLTVEGLWKGDGKNIIGEDEDEGFEMI